MAKTHNGTARDPPHSLVVLMPSSPSSSFAGVSSGCQQVVKHLVQGENWIRIVGPSAAASVDPPAAPHGSRGTIGRWSISILDNQEAANVMCMGTAEDALVCVDVDGSAMAMKDMRRKQPSQPAHPHPQQSQNNTTTPHVGLWLQRRRRRNKTQLPARQTSSRSTGYDSDDENDQQSSPSAKNNSHHHQRMDLVSGTEATNVCSGVKETTTTTMTNEVDGNKSNNVTTPTSGMHHKNHHRNKENDFSSSSGNNESYGALEVLPRRQLRLLRHGDRIVARFGLVDESPLILEYRLGPRLLLAASLTTKKVPKSEQGGTPFKNNAAAGDGARRMTELDSTSGDVSTNVAVILDKKLLAVDDDHDDNASPVPANTKSRHTRDDEDDMEEYSYLTGEVFISEQGYISAITGDEGEGGGRDSPNKRSKKRHHSPQKHQQQQQVSMPRAAEMSDQLAKAAAACVVDGTFQSTTHTTPEPSQQQQQHQRQQQRQHPNEQQYQQQHNKQNIQLEAEMKLQYQEQKQMQSEQNEREVRQESESQNRFKIVNQLAKAAAAAREANDEADERTGLVTATTTTTTVPTLEVVAGTNNETCDDPIIVTEKGGTPANHLPERNDIFLTAQEEEEENVERTPRTLPNGIIKDLKPLETMSQNVEDDAIGGKEPLTVAESCHAMDVDNNEMEENEEEEEENEMEGEMTQAYPMPAGPLIEESIVMETQAYPMPAGPLIEETIIPNNEASAVDDEDGAGMDDSDDETTIGGDARIETNPYDAPTQAFPFAPPVPVTNRDENNEHESIENDPPEPAFEEETQMISLIEMPTQLSDAHNKPATDHPVSVSPAELVRVKQKRDDDDDETSISSAASRPLVSNGVIEVKEKKPVVSDEKPAPTLDSQKQEQAEIKDEDEHADEETVESPRMRVVVMITGIQAAAKHKRMIQSIGAELVESVDDAAAATYVIAGDSKVPLRRTPKLMICLCRTSNIVNMKWLEDSAKAGKPLSCGDYLLLDDEAAENKYNFVMRQTLDNGTQVRTERGGLFGDRSIYFCSGVAGHGAPPARELELIVKAGGGSVVKVLAKVDASKVIIVAGDPPTANQMKERGVAVALRKGGHLCTTSWLFHCIITQCLSFDKSAMTALHPSDDVVPTPLKMKDNKRKSLKSPTDITSSGRKTRRKS